jgi:hypothetical protein
VDERLPGLPDELQKPHRAAIEFSESPEVLRVLGEAASDPELRKELEEDPQRFLDSRGVPVPEGVRLDLLQLRGPPMPGPDYEFFTIRQFNCKRYWLIKQNDDGKREVESVEICYGFELVPHPLPPIAK